LSKVTCPVYLFWGQNDKVYWIIYLFIIIILINSITNN
jgi:hypothetical protein